MNNKLKDDSTKARTYWRRFIKFPITRVIYEALIFFGVLYSVKEFLIKPGLALFSLEEALRINIQGLLTIIFAFLVYFLVVQIFEKREVFELAPKNLLKGAFTGIGLGFGAVSLSFLLLGLLGVFTITGVNDSFVLFYPLVWVFLLALVEELVFRGFLYRISEEGFGTHWALVISAVPFGVMHIFNDQADFLLVLSALSGGLAAGILYTLTKTLWAPIFFHAVWNFSQVIYGSNVSATDMFGAYLKSKLTGPDWLAGGATGMEGSVVTISLVFLMFGGLYWLAHRRGLIVKRTWKLKS